METNFNPEPQKKLTKIIIDLDVRATATNNENKVVADMKALRIERTKKASRNFYYDFKDLKNTGEVKIFTRSKSREDAEILLPKNMLRRLSDYLSSGDHSNEPHNCAAFAHVINGVEFNNNIYHPEKWEYSNFNEEIEPGETIAINTNGVPEKGDYVHFAISLGGGLYLSKFGNSGKLMVNDLHSLKKLFEGEHVFKIKPKPEFVKS